VTSFYLFVIAKDTDTAKDDAARFEMMSMRTMPDVRHNTGAAAYYAGIHENTLQKSHSVLHLSGSNTHVCTSMCHDQMRRRITA
jgi:hypothetical protein